MHWTERQVAMLREMGVRIWSAPRRAAQAAVPGTPGDLDAVPGLPDAPARTPSREGRVPRGAAPAPNPMPRAVVEAAPATPPGANDGLDWPELRAAVAACTACKLSQGRRQTVFGTGHPRAHWMIVGEAPGEQEDLQGEPFVGRSGMLLDNMLRALGLTRLEAPAERQVYIANAVKCRPPGNRNPEPQELACCEPFLVRQLQLVAPRIILAMGRVAAHSLLRNTEPIGRLRGHVHRYQGVAVVVTYHPAYLLRNPQDKAKAWDDLCLAQRTVAAPSAPAH